MKKNNNTVNVDCGWYTINLPKMTKKSINEVAKLIVGVDGKQMAPLNSGSAEPKQVHGWIEK